MRPLVLITGASSGIGLETALASAEAGFEVIATMRDIERRQQLDQAVEERGFTPPSIGDNAGVRETAAVHVEQLDVAARSVGAKVRELQLKYGPIEALVNNAGIAICGAFEEQSDFDVRHQFETNLFGAMAVTRALLPSMRALSRGRVINVSSISGRVGFPALAPYAATKHALSGFTEGLRYELAPHGIVVCLVEPGTRRTGIFHSQQRRGELVEEGGPYGELTENVTRALLDVDDSAPGPEVVAKTIARLLTAPSPPYRTVVGNQARAIAALRRVTPDELFSSALRRLIGI